MSSIGNEHSFKTKVAEIIDYSGKMKNNCLFQVSSPPRDRISTGSPQMTLVGYLQTFLPERRSQSYCRLKRCVSQADVHDYLEVILTGIHFRRLF